jgi:predicted membrane protein
MTHTEDHNPTDQRGRRHYNTGGAKRLMTGAILLAAGGFLLLNNFNLLGWYIEDIIFSWQMLLIAIGFISLAGRNYTGAIILFAIGGFFLLPDIFNTMDINFIKLFWPIVIIIIGLTLIIRRKSYAGSKKNSEYTDNYIDEMNIFGGSERIITSEYFEGGKITSIFGGSNVNLKNVKLKNGYAEIEMTSIFGGAKIYVPENWDVRIEATSIFGGINDKRQIDISEPNSSNVLVIKGAAIFGGGEIMS